MKFQVAVTNYETVDIPSSNIAEAMYRECMHKLKPAEVKEYDDWIIYNGNLVGITEYPRGNDTRTDIGKASEELVKNYEAIQLVSELLRKGTK